MPLRFKGTFVVLTVCGKKKYRELVAMSLSKLLVLCANSPSSLN
jgi:hypothetical protein